MRKLRVFESISVDAHGIVTGSFSNGVSHALAQIAVAQFNNPSGLLQWVGGAGVDGEDPGPVALLRRFAGDTSEPFERLVAVGVPADHGTGRDDGDDGVSVLAPICGLDLAGR